MERKYALLYIKSEDKYAVIYRDDSDWGMWYPLPEIEPISSLSIAEKVLKGLSS